MKQSTARQGLAALLLGAFLGPVAAWGAIDLDLRWESPSDLVNPGEQARVGVYVVSTGATAVPVSALELLLGWDRDVWAFVGEDKTGGIAGVGWVPGFFPYPDNFGVNETGPYPQDGDGWYTWFADPFHLPMAEAGDGTLMTTFVLEAKVEVSAVSPTTVFVINQITVPMGTMVTVVTGGAGDNATGQLGSVTIPGSIVGPVATAWRSVRTHGGTDDRAIELDPAADAANAAVEPRVGGIQKVEVDFSGAVQVVGTLEAVNVNTSVAYPATSVTLIGGDMTLVVSFDPGVLPDQATYVIDLAGKVQGSQGQALDGDADCLIRSLASDVNGSGLVDNSDLIDVRVRRGQSVTDERAPYDVDCSGVIDNSDLIAVRVRRGNAITGP